MAFWHKNKNWEDQYDEYYAQDRRLGNEGRKSDNRLRFFTHGLALILVGAVFLGAVGLVNGQTMIEKLLSELAMPIGFVWLLLLLMIYFCLLNRQSWPAIIGFVCWLLLTLAGNDFVSNWLASSLEASYQRLEVYEMEPFDAIVVLGGGTSSRMIGGKAQLAASGDRVATAARLYHAKKVKQLICTGSNSFQISADDPPPREEAAEILIDLGVSAEDVLQIQGKNTFEEMKNLKKLLAKFPELQRVGIVSSAWHLPRVIRLAQSNGLELIPIPSNFYSKIVGPSPNMIVPGDDNLAVTTYMLKEYLAKLVGR